jgi:hypothetical protein
MEISTDLHGDQHRSPSRSDLIIVMLRGEDRSDLGIL